VTRSPLAVRDATVVEAALSRTRALVRPELDAAQRRLSPELRASVAEHLSGGGKMVRAAMVLLSASACGGDERDGLAGAVALELVHNFSLVHDDVIDGDLTRRHRPTMWARHGVNHAVIAGDALATLAFQVLLEVPSAEHASAASLLADATQAMISGQALDMALEQRATATLDECLEMVSGKTAALVRCAACLGAVLCGAPDPTISALWEFGHHLGVAFQAVDDVLGVWGDEARTGKSVGNDLRRRKKTLPVCIATSQGVSLPDAFTTPTAPIGDDEVDEIREVLDACGARAATVDLAERHLGDALSALDRVALAPTPRAELAALAAFVVERDQ
jgi:geranylgeranyl diphosphate synthase type I